MAGEIVFIIEINAIGLTNSYGILKYKSDF